MDIAIVGTGRGSVHARWIAQCPEFSVTAVACAQDTEAAAEMVRTHHLHAEVTTDALSLIRHGRIDAVAITTPTHSRHELVSEALTRGLLVMCEAPLAASRQSALKLAELARAQDARAIVAFQLRENPALRHARQAIAEGAVGELLAIDLGLHDDAHTRTAGPGGRRERRDDDGALTELGTHAFDLVPWLTGMGLWEVSSAWTHCLQDGRSGHDAVPRNVDDIAQAELRTLGCPTRARVMVSRTGTPQSQLLVTAHGDRGVIHVRVNTADGSGLFTLYTGSRDAQQLFGPHPMNPYRRLADDLDSGVRPVSGFDDGLAALTLVDAALGVGGTERREGRVP
ncbi:Gfo/Idh/MocA family protein [Streptomyces sp. NPDC058632]|uniref:Gfo/Idh/MocA family protein n=1 Tax=unclassified Streptomyces TaxID=2593676 RepID=UPI00364E2766